MPDYRNGEQIAKDKDDRGNGNALMFQTKRKQCNTYGVEKKTKKIPIRAD